MFAGGSKVSMDGWTFGGPYGLRDNNIGAPMDTERLETFNLTADYQFRENTTTGIERGFNSPVQLYPRYDA